MGDLDNLGMKTKCKCALPKITVLVMVVVLSFWFLHTSAFLKRSSRKCDTVNCPGFIAQASRRLCDSVPRWTKMNVAPSTSSDGGDDVSITTDVPDHESAGCATCIRETLADGSRETVAQCGEGWCTPISQSLQRGDDPILLQCWSCLSRTGSKVDAAWSSVAHSRLCASISKMLETMYIGMASADCRKNSSAYIWFVHTHIIIMWK